MSTAFTDALTAIYSRLNANWLTTPIDKKDNARNFTPAEGTDYLLFDVYPAVDNLSSLGPGTTGRSRLQGIIYGEVRVATNTGIATAYSLSDEFATLFKNQCFSGVRVRGLSFDKRPEINGNWYISIITLPFEYDYIP